MSTYFFEMPTTGAFSFRDVCTDQSAEKLYSSHLSEVTQARANLRGALKEIKRTNAEKDFLQLAKILEEYIPLLIAVIACSAHDEIGHKSEPIFSWRTTLSANVFNSTPRLSVPSLYADLAFSLLTYGFSLSNLARSIVGQLGSYEHDCSISDIDRKSKDERLNHAVTFLCRASGIFTYISDKLLPEWERSIHGDSIECIRPPDLSREVNSALAKMSLADAQSLAIRKLLSKSTYDSNVAPGPPLSKSHPSPALLSKLHLECAQLYTSARTLAKTPAASDGSAGEVSTDFRHYLANEAIFHSALGRKWLGVDAGENGGSEKGGEALGFMLWALKDMEGLKDGSSGKGLILGKGEKEKNSLRKGKVADELESMKGWAKHYKKMNDTVYFQPVLTQADLQARISTGRLAVTPKPYTLPTPAFGPDSVDLLIEKTENLRFDWKEKSQEGDYAGAGSYF